MEFQNVTDCHYSSHIKTDKTIFFYHALIVIKWYSSPLVKINMIQEPVDDHHQRNKYDCHDGLLHTAWRVKICIIMLIYQCRHNFTNAVPSKWNSLLFHHVHTQSWSTRRSTDTFWIKVWSERSQACVRFTHICERLDQPPPLLQMYTFTCLALVWDRICNYFPLNDDMHY